MIERYTIKFVPAVSQKELEKALHEGIVSPLQTVARPDFIDDIVRELTEGE